jgi:hypothetical protein
MMRQDASLRREANGAGALGRQPVHQVGNLITVARNQNFAARIKEAFNP